MPDVICILAIGSVGDVLPLAHLATRLSDGEINVIVASHLHHKAWLVPLIERAGVSFRPLTLPPAQTWNKDSQGILRNLNTEEHLEACIAVCEEAFGVKVKAPIEPATKEDEQQGRGRAEYNRLIVHNLFALEAFHIAEALDVSSMVVSACLPYPPPASFQTRLKAAYPRLWEALQRKGDGVRWAEIELWMWPLFTERWGAWRQQQLHLPPVPYQTASNLPPAPLLLLCLSPQLVDQPASWPPSVKVCGSCIAVECSELPQGDQHFQDRDRLERRSHAAAAKQEDSPVHLHGGKCINNFQRGNVSTSTAPLYSIDQNLEMAELPELPILRHDECASVNDSGGDKLSSKGGNSRLVCFDFGSMGSMGFLGNAKPLLEILARALEQAGLRGVLLTGQWGALSAAYQEMYASSCVSALTALEGFVDHAQLFSQCCALVHHGGAGTVAAALRAGLPSVICPLQFDQFMWADKLEHMGLATVLPGKDFFSSPLEGAAAKLSACLLAVTQSDAMRSNCRHMQHEMAAEDGAQVAAGHIRQALRSGKDQSEAKEVIESSLKELVCLPNGWEVHASSPSEALFLYREIFEEHCYLQHGITVREGDIVVDVGANIGLFSLYLLSKARCERPARIWALEPLLPNVCKLRKNVAAFGAGDKVSIVSVALGRTIATAPFTYYPRMPGNSTSRPAEKAALQAESMHASRFEDTSVHACQVTTLDDFMRQHNVRQIDLLKVDVEGDEEDVLLGLSQWERVAQVVVEVHTVHGRVDRIRKLLEDNGLLVVVDQGCAPNAVMIYAACEDRLLSAVDEM